VCEPQEAVVLALAFAQRVRTLEPLIGESFLTFAQKVSSMKLDKFADVALQKVQFGPGAYNQAMHKVVVLLSTVMTEKAAEVLSTIDFLYGKDVVSNSYSKLWRLLSSSQKLAGEEKRSDTFSMAEAIQWLVESLFVALRTNRVSARNLTVENLDKHPKTGTPGHLQVWSCRAQARTLWHLAHSFHS
jgi:hypothetical protein